MVNENGKIVLPKKKSIWKTIIFFLIFEFVFSCVTMPLLVFFGPFDNVKKTVVGTLTTTRRFGFLVTSFLSDNAINRLRGGVQNNTGTVNFDILKFDDSNKSDKIDLFNIDGGDFKGKMLVIHDPSRVIVGYSSQMPKAGETTSSIAKREKAVAAINAGGFIDQNWTGTGGKPTGIVMSEGKLVYDPQKSEDATYEVIGLTDKDQLIVGHYSLSYLKKIGLRDAVCFGPALIINGKGQIKGDGGWGKAPRTVIGQKRTGEIVFLVIDGRSFSSLGASLRDVQEVLLSNDVVNAANLDGGSSTTMFYQNKIINTLSDPLGERTVPTTFLVKP